MPTRNHPRRLLVEGVTDKSVIPYLMEENGVLWPSPNFPVNIDELGSVDEVLKPGVLEAYLNTTGEALGLVVDANGDAAARWDQLRAICNSEFVDVPQQIPSEGLQIVHSSGSRFGVWIMPDNEFAGMLEDLLVRLIPDDSRGLFTLARNCVAEARSERAPFRDVHERKAEVYTWLAWQDPPGLRLHEAVKHRVLDPTRPESRPFVNWFKSLFRV